MLSSAELSSRSADGRMREEEGRAAPRPKSHHQIARMREGLGFGTARQVEQGGQVGQGIQTGKGREHIYIRLTWGTKAQIPPRSAFSRGRLVITPAPLTATLAPSRPLPSVMLHKTLSPSLTPHTNNRHTCSLLSG